MGKKGNWFSAIKRVFIPSNSRKDNEKKGRRGKLKHGESKSFIPLFREPSSIEKILEEADQAKLFRQHSSASSDQSTKFPPLFIQRATHPHPNPPRIRSPNSASSRINRPVPTQSYRHFSATKIQAAYRGYVARRSFRALKGLVRLQGVIRGKSVKRQTANAMKMMQLLVRVQTQVQSRRIHMLENQAMQRRQAQKIDREFERTTVQNDEWDDSMLPKEEREARLQRKVEAMMKRERAMSYAHSHKLWKATPKSASAGAMDNIGHGGYPWWWNWLERQLPPPKTTPDWSSTKNFKMTPQSQRATPQQPKPSPSPASYGLDNMEILTPSSTKSVFPTRSKPLFNNNTPLSRTPLVNGLGQMRYSKNDDDSLTSCPPFSVPNYMTSTVSTNAKVRACSNPKERFPTPETPINDSKKRFSFPLTPNFSSFKWNNKGSNDKDSNSNKVLDQHQPIHATGNTSIDSTVSMPAVVGGRKPFNRFV